MGFLGSEGLGLRAAWGSSGLGFGVEGLGLRLRGRVQQSTGRDGATS